MDDFKEIIYENTNSKTEILIVLDCCYSLNFTLSYNNDNEIVGDYPKRKMIVLSQSENLSLLTNYGSLFSRGVIKSLEDNISNLKTLKKNVNGNMRNSNGCIIYKSLKSITAVFPWIIPCGLSVGDCYIYEN